jgi:hypothetical protein
MREQQEASAPSVAQTMPLRRLSSPRVTCNRRSTSPRSQRPSEYLTPPGPRARHLRSGRPSPYRHSDSKIDRAVCRLADPPLTNVVSLVSSALRPWRFCKRSAVVGLDDNQQWTPSRRRDASSASGSDSRGRGLRRRGFPERTYASPRHRLLDANDPANSGDFWFRPAAVVRPSAAGRLLCRSSGHAGSAQS